MEQQLLAADKEIQDPLVLLQEVVREIRPKHPSNVAAATEHILSLAARFEADPLFRQQVRFAIDQLFSTRKAGSLYMDTGILPNTGFFSETWRRIAQTLLPEIQNPAEYLGDTLLFLFDQGSDALWVTSIEDEVWITLLKSLCFDEDADPRVLPGGLPVMLNNLWLLSYRMTALGFDSELLRLDAALSRNESPFLAQNLETRVFIECCLYRWEDPAAVAEDEKHLLVLFDQCGEAVERIHRRASQDGTSLQLTYKLQCLKDHILRCEQLAMIAGELQRDRSGLTAYPPIVALFKTLVFASCRRNDLRTFWQQTLEMTARRVTEHAGKTGEHYITDKRQEYFGMAKAAIGAGGFIALMAFIKLLLHDASLAPLNEMLAFGLNYGIGFMVIYMLGFTVATKQPAMTANALAASIGEAKGKVRDLENLITLIARTIRSQLVAILGNVSIAVPVAIAISVLMDMVHGNPVLSAGKADEILSAHHPLESGALFYASIAGGCLFLSGLISGYFDNLAIYHRIPQRIKQLPWALRLVGEKRLCHFADYVEIKLGALAGNFLFGMMLAGVWGLGMLLGLPIDIRHVAFSSAYLGYAAAAYDFAPPVLPFIWATVGIMGIGILNLAVSFFLALFVALRARNVTFTQGGQLVRGLLRRLLTHPRDFFLPPKE